MFDPEDFYHGAVDPVADDVWSEGHEFTYISTNLTASMWLVRQALNGRHQAKGEPVGGQGRELANIGADALQVAARSRRPDHAARRDGRFGHENVSRRLLRHASWRHDQKGQQRFQWPTDGGGSSSDVPHDNSQ